MSNLSIDEDTDNEWLAKETESFCKDKAVYNAIMQSIHIIDGKSQTQTENAIPEILSDALSVSFDVHIGHDNKRRYTPKDFEYSHGRNWCR